MSIRVSRKIDLLRVHWDETEFSLDLPLPVVVPFFINKEIAERLFLSRGILKILPEIKRLICKKDNMALKTSTKMVVYMNKCIWPGNIWWVFIILGTSEQILYVKVTLVKIHCQILFNKRQGSGSRLSGPVKSQNFKHGG